MTDYISEVSMITNSACKIVKNLSELYNFNYDDALKFLLLEDNSNINKVGNKTTFTEKISSSIPLPFCGIIYEDCCKGIKLNHSLYTQCQSKPVNGDFCKVCYNQTLKNSSNKPTYGGNFR